MHWTLCNNDCFQLFENLFILSQKTIPHKRWLKLHQKKMRVLCFVWRKGYVHICLQLFFYSSFTIVHNTVGSFWFFYSAFNAPTKDKSLCSSFHAYIRNRLVLQLYFCSMFSASESRWMTINLFIFRLRCSCSDWLEKKNRICYTLNFITYSCIPYRIPILWMELQLWRRMKWMHGFLIPVQNAGKL